MKSKFFLLLIVPVFFIKNSHAAKLVFNQVINNVGTIDVPGMTYPNPMTTTLGTVPANKVWKVVAMQTSPTATGSIGWGYQKWALNGFDGISTAWLKAGDIISIKCTNSTAPVPQQNILNNYIINYCFSVIEFDVVP
jgi:hypothetical protein